MKVQIKPDAFKGMTDWNGLTAVLQKKKDKSGEMVPETGVSGNTMCFKIPNGGSLFLSADQYDVIN